jgi:hypothetical protein
MSGCRFRYDDLPPDVKAQVDALAGRRPRKRRPREPNKTEAAYRVEIIGPRPDVVAAYYEGLTFRMANGHRYTPDWVVVTDEGRVECHEVKGAYALHSQQRARLAFDQARVEFPWVTWVWVTKTKDGWRNG